MTRQTPDLRHQLHGVIPPIAMPFDEKGRLVRNAMREQIDLIVNAGVSGVVVGGSDIDDDQVNCLEFCSADARTNPI